MRLTYGETKKTLAEYAGKAGKCANSEDVDLFLKTVFHYLLTSGDNAGLRKYCFHAVEGCFTVPNEIETIVKGRIDNQESRVWDQWFEWYNTTALTDCNPDSDAIFQEPGYFPTAYPLPVKGSRVGVIGICEESSDAHVIVNGKDTTGREIFTTHKGEQVPGEYLSIIKGQLRCTTVKFGEITGIQKSKTNGYVQLYSTNEANQIVKFLSDYSPIETHPQYRKFCLRMSGCPRIARVSILARIRIKDNYSDNEYIPFDNIYALQMAAQHVQANYNNNMEVAKAKDGMVSTLIARDNGYKNPSSGQPFQVCKSISPGRIKNIVS